MEEIPADLLPRNVENTLNMELLPGSAMNRDIQALAGELDFTMDEINYVCQQKCPFMFFLDQWCKREGRKATMERLQRALEEIERTDMAEYVRKTIETLRRANFDQLQSLAKVQYEREQRRESEFQMNNDDEEEVEEEGTDEKGKSPFVYIVFYPESEEFEKQVTELANDLRKQQIDARTGVMEEGSSSDKHFYVFSNLQKADFVLLVCSSAVKSSEQLLQQKEQLRKYNDNIQELVFSLNFMVKDIYRKKSINAKYVPVFMSKYEGENLPSLLKINKSYTIPDEFDSLVRRIYREPEYMTERQHTNAPPKKFQPRIIKS